MKFNNAIGEGIVLRALAVEDYHVVLNWCKDEAFCKANGWSLSRTEEEVYKWWLGCVHNDFKDFIRKGIEYNGEFIGYADLACIQEGSAEIGIAIGESTLWGRGIGGYVTQCMMAYGFEELGITVFYAETHETNLQSRRMLEKIGFREVSRNGYEEYLGAAAQLIRYKLHYT